MTDIDYKNLPLEELLADDTSPTNVIFEKLNAMSWMDFDDDIITHAMMHKNGNHAIKKRCFTVGMMSYDVSLYNILDLWFSNEEDRTQLYSLISMTATVTTNRNNIDNLFSTLSDIIADELKFVDFSFLHALSFTLAWSSTVSTDVVETFFTNVFNHPNFDIDILKDLYANLKTELFDMADGAIISAILASDKQDSITSDMYTVTSDVRLLPKDCTDIFWL